MALLEIRNLVVRYGEIEALRGVSIAVEEGQVVTLLGANGAGKSTTLRAISGLAKPASGDILFDGRSIAGRGPEAIVRMGISHVPEGRRVFPGLTVKENIMLGASNRKASTSEISREADAMFDLFPEIRSFSNALGWTLSGGQLQMVAVARGLMAKPRLLLLDEPSLGLAPVIVQAVFRIISQIRQNTPRSCSSSKMRAWDFRSPIRVLSSKPDASCSAASPSNCGTTKPSPPPISAVTSKPARNEAS
jgi:branched-chain amino acid transport system ATP-binding protein